MPHIFPFFDANTRPWFSLELMTHLEKHCNELRRSKMIIFSPIPETDSLMSHICSTEIHELKVIDD